MSTEALLAFLHISAFIGWIVFATAQTALCRPDWFNAAALARLLRLDTILWLATAAVLLSALARIYLGVKGSAWYWSNPLLHLKLTLFVVAALLQVGPARQYRRWRTALQLDGRLPSASELAGARRLLMIATHLVAVIPLPAVFMARGFG